LRHLQADETFRTSPWGALVFPVVLLAAGVLLGWALARGWLSEGRGDVPWIPWAGCVFLGLGSLFAFRVNFIPALAPSNWVLKLEGNRLYLMLRNYRNAHLPDDAPVVVSFETGEIESVGQQENRVCVPSSDRGGTRDWKERRLEIRLRNPVPQEFVMALQTQPEWSGTGGVRSKNTPSPVSYDEQTIRILWSGPGEGISPRIDRALAILGRVVPVRDKSIVDRTRLATLTDSELDDHILELCQAGTPWTPSAYCGNGATSR